MILIPELLEWFLTASPALDDQDPTFNKKDAQNRPRVFGDKHFPDQLVFNKLFSSIPNIIDPRFIAKTTDDNIAQAVNTLNTTIKHGLVTLTTDAQAEQRDDGDTNVARTLKPSQIVINGSKQVDSESKLKAVPTINTPVGIIFQYKDSATGNLLAYKLEAGTDTEVSPNVLRPIDYNTTTNAKVWKQAVVGGSFQSQLNGTLAMPQAWNALPIGTTINDLQGKSLTTILEDALFPTIDAYIQTNSGLILSNLDTTAVEVGTSFQAPITVTFNRGQINNGDNTVAGTVSTDLIEVLASLPNSTNNDYSNNQPISDTDTFTMPPYILNQGNNIYTVKGNNLTSTTTYTDNKGNQQTIQVIEDAKADTIPDNITFNKPAYYNRWHYLGTAAALPTTSATVRNLNTNVLLDINNNASFSVAIPPSERFSLYVPDGKTVTIIDTGGALDIDVTPTPTQIIINDAGGNQVNYEQYTVDMGLGYTAATTFTITIT